VAPSRSSSRFDPLEEICRDVNLQIFELSGWLAGDGSYFCECGDATCGATVVTLSPLEFTDVITVPGQFVVARGHERPGMEIVRELRGYFVVRHGPMSDNRR